MALSVPSNRAGYFDSVRSYFPTGTKSLRACIQCRVIMEKNQFIELGCPQCHDLKMQEDERRVTACTTQNFEGIIANIRPGGFSTRFTGLEKRMPGFYALVVRGEIPANIMMDHVDDDLKSFVRDGSESPSAKLEDELFGQPSQPKAKKRKIESERTQVGMPQPPSRDSSTSDAEIDDRALKALDFIASASESEEVDASGRPKDQIIPSASEQTGVSASERARTASQHDSGPSAGERTKSSQHGVSSTSEREKLSGASQLSGAESQKSGHSRSSRHSRQSKDSERSGKTNTSDRSRSVAILEPEVDTEFDRAPE